MCLLECNAKPALIICGFWCGIRREEQRLSGCTYLQVHGLLRVLNVGPAVLYVKGSQEGGSWKYCSFLLGRLSSSETNMICNFQNLKV
jgi:hypothetical protein